MRLKFYKTALSPQVCEMPINALQWSPNCKRLAVCTYDRVVMIFNENGEKKERFVTKAGDSKSGKKTYIVKALAYSHDSLKLAVGQSDSIVYVYKFGENWEDKKVICNKFPQPSAVTCIKWPAGQLIICGLADGKVRAANIRTNRSSTIYSADSYTVSLALSPNGKGFISGHADGKIIRYFFDDEGTGSAQGKFTTHPVPPFALAWANNTILAGGCDQRICIYGKDGNLMQQFDYRKEEGSKALSVAEASPSGHTIAFGSYDKIRIFNWSLRKAKWEEEPSKELQNFYTIMSMSWRKDGSVLAVGTLCGGVELFEYCIRKQIYKNLFEINYVGLSQVIVENIKTNDKLVLKSQFDYKIDRVNIMGNDRYLIVHTSDSVMLGDMKVKRLSEVPWYDREMKEKFYFGYDKFCIIFGAGEVSIVEYGMNEILGSVRTECMSPYLLSVRIKGKNNSTNDVFKVVAYMIDVKTVGILDLVSGKMLCEFAHDVKIDWLELNDVGKYILMRDKRFHLLLGTVETGEKSQLLNFCSFVQWVPGSNIVVAQSRENMCIWYNIEAVDRVTTVPLKGCDVISIEKHLTSCKVLLSDGVNSSMYNLDDNMIAFSNSMDDVDFEKAIETAENLDQSVDETVSIWEKLGDCAKKEGNVSAAERCFAALGDISKTRFLNSAMVNNDAYSVNRLAKARLAMIDKDYKLAEEILLEVNAVEEIINMYKSINKWTEALEVSLITLP